MFLDLFEEQPLLGFVHLFNRPQDLEVVSTLLRRPDQSFDVFRKARSAIARPGEQKGRSDAVVGTHAMSHERDIRSGQIAHPRHFVHETDAGRQHGVRDVFRQLRGRDIHEDDRIAGAHERFEQLAEHLPRSR